jgi:polyisoprenyl-phosphate glycosyltransferase
VMDADGEDRPEDVPRLLAKLRELRGSSVVFAERGRRVEGLVFRLGYVAYRLLHRVLTGIPVRIGNFSLLPAKSLDTVVVLGEMWNHYAAAIVKSRLPYVTVRMDRGRRLAGRSRMNLVALVFHGLSALATFAEIIITRVLCATFLLTASLVLGLLVVAGARAGTQLVLPGWTAILAVLFAVTVVQLAITVFGLACYALALHANTAFLPIRDHAFFVHTLDTIHER